MGDEYPDLRPFKQQKELQVVSALGSDYNRVSL